MKRNWMAFCLAAALMTAGTVYAKPAPSQLVPEKHGQCYVEDNLFVKDVNGAGGGQPRGPAAPALTLCTLAGNERITFIRQSDGR